MLSARQLRDSFSSTRRGTWHAYAEPIFKLTFSSHKVRQRSPLHLLGLPTERHPTWRWRRICRRSHSVDHSRLPRVQTSGPGGGPLSLGPHLLRQLRHVNPLFITGYDVNDKKLIPFSKLVDLFGDRNGCLGDVCVHMAENENAQGVFKYASPLVVSTLDL